MKRIMGIAVITAVVAVLLLAGCATSKTGTDRMSTTNVTMVEVEEDIRLLLLELTATNSALASLVNPLQNDITTAFNVYSDGIESLKKASSVFIAKSAKMGSEGRDYFNEWRIQGKTYTNPQIQKLSEQRRSELGVVYTQIADSSVGLEGDLKKYVLNVEELKKYFSNDLTAKGVTSINPFANRTIIEGFDLSVQLRNLLETVSMARAELSTGKIVIEE